MFEAPDLAEGQIVGNGDVRNVIYGQDSGLYVEFRMEDVYQEYASEQAGKPIYESVPFIRMYTPGDKTKVVDRKVEMKPRGDIPSDPQRFPQQWAAFQAGAKAIQSGTPLAEWPKMSTTQVRELNAINVYTVEALAAISDAALDGLGHGGRSMRDAAAAWLDAARDGASLSAALAANAHLQEQIDALKASITSSPEVQRGPGRPRKEVIDGE